MLVAILMGSHSDLLSVRPAQEVLATLAVPSEIRILSAHRTPSDLLSYVENSKANVFIAAAGGAAHLAGVIAAHTIRPVIAVPIKTDMAGGLDSLLSSVQMPKGIPVACVGVNNAQNAGILAAEMLAMSDKDLAQRIIAFREYLRKSVIEDNERLNQ